MAEHSILTPCVFGLGQIQNTLNVEKESRLCVILTPRALPS